MPARSVWQPTFIGIGAAKCATTWCWESLRKHPQVDAGQPKEINFFRVHFDRGVEWYARHFRQHDRSIRGEISPLYMDDPRAAERISRLFPTVKLLVVLRNPYERALSNLLHDVRDLDGAVAATTEDRLRELAAADPKYLRRSLYAKQLRPFFARFERQQFAVLFYETLERDPQAFLRQLYAAVGADPDFAPADWEAPVNRTQDYRWPRVFKLLQTASQSANSLPPTRAAMQWVYRHTRLREWTLKRLAVDRGRPTFRFEHVFGADAVNAVARDIDQLQASLQLRLPEGWWAHTGEIADAA